MLHTSNPTIKHKADSHILAEELGNVSKACKVMGFSGQASNRNKSDTKACESMH